MNAGNADYEAVGRMLRGEKPTAAQVIDAAFALIIQGQDATALAELARKLVHEQAKKIDELNAARDLLRRLARCAYKPDGERVEIDMSAELWEELRLVGINDVWSAGAKS